MKTQQPIQRRDLARSLIACHRVEDAQWRKLQGLGISEESHATAVRQALTEVRQDCPAWCELDAWERIADVYERWADVFGTLKVFWRLRRKQEA